MKDLFRVAHPELKKKDVEHKFYDSYFLEISKQTGIEIEHFYDPKNSLGGTSNVPKTINGGYIKNISKSKQFKDEFFAFMNLELKEQNRVSLDPKIDTLVQKWEKQLLESSDSHACVIFIRNYIEKNKKGKLPWTLKEIDEAIKSVNWLFDSSNDRK